MALVAKKRSPVPALAQLRSNVVSPLQAQVADFLKRSAQRTESRMLSLVAVRVAEDPYKKVNKMIKDMIQKLMEEANEEAEHKGFCDTEMTTNKQTRDSKSEDVDEFTAQTEKLSADIQELAGQISTLATEIAELDAAVQKATSERELEKAKNQETLKDSKAAQEATSQAMQVLKEFYEKAADAAAAPPEAEVQGDIKYDSRAIQILSKGGAALVQTKAKVPGAPEMEDGAYTGQGGQGGIIGLLEVIESDFARVIAETSASERESTSEFERFTADSAEDKAVKETESKNKIGAKTRAESSLASAEKDLRTSKDELTAAMEYFEKLKPSCVDAGVSYEERVARRKEEIESLQEALKILAQE